jgi:hypothetical protein
MKFDQLEPLMKAVTLTAILVFGSLGTTSAAADNDGSSRVAFLAFA